MDRLKMLGIVEEAREVLGRHSEGGGIIGICVSNYYQFDMLRDYCSHIDEILHFKKIGSFDYIAFYMCREIESLILSNPEFNFYNFRQVFESLILKSNEIEYFMSKVYQDECDEQKFIQDLKWCFLALFNKYKKHKN